MRIYCELAVMVKLAFWCLAIGFVAGLLLAW